MKRMNLKSFAAGFTVCAVMMCGSIVFGETIQKTIDVTFGQIKLVVDGKPVEKETMLYNGTTYVPLRAAADIFGKEMGYDSATKTAYIGQIPDSAKPVEEKSPVQSTSSVSQADLEKEYMKLMVDLYYGLMDSIDKLESEFAAIEDNPMLITDKTWLAGLNKAMGDFSATLAPLVSYDPAKVPDAYKEFHNTFVGGCNDFNKGMDKLVYGIENLDLNAISEAEALIESATNKLDKASALSPEF